MKKQAIKGWAYPCDKENILKFDSFGILYLCADEVYKTKKGFKEIMPYCECDKKKCRQPVRVKVTIEELKRG